MANSDRDIRIVPDRGASTAPAMYFTGADSLSSATIVLRVFNSSTDATLSFEGDVGQLFSITDSTFGPVFSVNDISGIPSIEVLDSGLIKLAEWNGKVQIGGANNNENATSTATGELQVIGGVGVSKDVYVGGGMTVVGTLNAAVVTGSISNSANVAVTNDTASSTAQYLTFVSGTSGNLPIKVDSSALTFVPSTNNLGIGTTNPYSKLSLVSSAATDGISLFTSTYEAGRQWGTRIWKNDTGAGIPLQIDTQQTTTWYTTIRMGHGQDTNNPALITYYNTQLAMTSGNVGVGITPTNKLHVSGDSKVAGTFVGLRQYQTGDDFRIDFVKAANDTASARFEWNGYSAATTHLIDYFSIGLNDAASAMQTRFQIMQDGRIGLNTTDFAYTSSDNTAVVAGGIAANKVFVNGSVQLIGANDAIVFGRGTSSFMKDEELGFGWGGGWYMTDATYLRSRNNKHVYNEAEFSGSKFQGYSTSYNKESFLVPRWNDNDWAFGIASDDSSFYWLQGRYYGNGTNNRGFRIKNSNGGAIVFAVNEKVIATQNTIYGTWQSYTGSDNGPMKTWDGVLVAGSDNTGAATYTVIETNVPQDSYMMGGFTINWFENYSSTNAKTKIEIAGYWNPASNGGHIGFEYTSSNPGISPTIQVGRNTSNGKTVFVLTHFSSNYAIIVARDLWLGYSGGSYDYGSGWTMSQTSSLAAYSNLVGVVARTVSASGGAGSGINADLLDGIDSTGFVFNGTTTNGSININGGTANAANDGTVYITATNNNDWGLIVNKYNASATEYGIDLRMGNAATYALRVQGNGVDKMRINGEGQIFAPIYYDYNDSSYFVDPNSESRLNGRLTVAGGHGDSSLQVRLNAAENGAGTGIVALQMWCSEPGNTWDWAGFGYNVDNSINDGVAPYHFGRVNSAFGQAYMRMSTTGQWYFYTTTAAGARTTNMYLAPGNGVETYGRLTNDTRVDAPIFYDSNDTAFYVNPNSTSRIRRTDLIASGAGWDDGLNLYSADQSNRWNLLVDNGAADSLRIAYNNAEALSINTSRNVTANVDIRAPIFYDSNNTSYYADPASTSRFNAIIANSINVSGTGSSNSNEYLFNCDASATQARRFEIARIGIDFNDWNTVGGFEIELHEKYYGRGLIKKYTVFYGYVSSFGVHLTHYSGSGDNNFQVTTSGETIVSGDQRYISVFVDVRYYSSVTAIVKTTRNITTSNPPGVGQTFIFSTPTITNIADFSADTIVFVPTSVQAGSDFRAPIFYDSNDTTYYVDPNSTSYQRSLFLGAHDSGAAEFRFGEDSAGWYGDRWYWDSSFTTYRYSRFAGTDSLIHYHDTRDTTRITYGRNIVFDNYGKGVVGTYTSTRLQGVFAMGDAYKLPADGSTAGTLYGIAWSHPNAGTIGGANNLASHGMLILENGAFRGAWGGGRLVTTSDIRGTLFYDYNNTAFYVDPNGTSNVSGDFRINQSGSSGLQLLSTTGTQSLWIRTGWDSAPTPSVSFNNVQFQSSGSSGGSFTFYSGNTLALTITSDYAQGAGSLRAPIFYDSNNTGYYVDPAGVSNLNNVLMLSAVSNNNNGLRNVMPGGGVYVTSASSVTGAIVITLPETVFPMLRFTVKVYTYDGLSFDINCGGHTSGGTWYNTFAYMTTQNRPALNVRFTYGGGRVYVYIGELSTVWSYPQVFITDVQVGYTNYEYSRWDDGWTIGFNASTYNTISATQTVYPPQTTTNNSNAAYASIYYDSNNTAFFADPNSRSRLSTIDFGSSGYYIGAGSWGMRNTTPFGYIEFGPANTSHAHIYTDRTNFYFNAQIQVNGGSNINTSDIRANIFYDNNNTGFYTDPASTSRMNLISVSNVGVTTGGTGSGIDLNAAGNGYLFGTTGDGANSTIANVKLTSWFGIGFAPSITGQAVPQWQNAAWIDVRSGAFSSRNEVTAYSSDQRLKTNFKNIENPIEKVKQIGGYEFDWDYDKCIGLGFKPSNIHEHGVKAQEIQKVVPDAVKVAPFDDDGEGNSKSGENYLTVKYDRLVPLLIEAIKEQQTTIDSLSKQVEELTVLVQNLINKSN